MMAMNLFSTKAAKRRGTLALASLAILLAATVFAWQLIGAGAPAAGVSAKAAPSAQFKLIDGRVLKLAQMRGQVVLVDFWATTCAVCLVEMPEVQALANELRAHGLIVVAVAMPYDRPDHVLHVVEARQIGVDVALDIDGAVTNSLGPVRGTPTRVLIDRNGMIAERIEGALPAGELRGKLLAALKG